MKKLTFILLLFTNFINAQNLDTLTLSQFLVLAKQKQIGIKEATLNGRVAALNFAIYKGSLKPQIDLWRIIFMSWLLQFG